MSAGWTKYSFIFSPHVLFPSLYRKESSSHSSLLKKYCGVHCVVVLLFEKMDRKCTSDVQAFTAAGENPRLYF